MQLFEHDFKPIVINLGSPYIGVDDSTFETLQINLEKLDSSITCDEKSCYGKNEKDFYLEKMSDFSMKLSNK